MDYSNPPTIGIDFGTSKCCVAAVRGGRVHVLENEFGQRTTPSCVAFTSQQRLVGGAALDQAVVNCANTVHAVKRTLGRTYDQVKAIPSACKIKKEYYPNSDAFQYCVSYRKAQLQLSPEQITAMLLTKMKDIAESSLGCPVKQAVISVPASFGNAQRAALLTAARVAGLEVLQLINETTAAGVAFEDNRTVKTAVTIAVVDFGAGKLDVSLMEVKEGSVRVIAAAGSPYLGGCGLDEVLVEHCGNVIRRQHRNYLKIDNKAHVKLRLACEKVKKTLSLLPEAQLSIESLVKDIDVRVNVLRKDFCELMEVDVRSAIVGTFDRLFKQKSITKDTIDKVVLVGGSMRIPAVKSILEEYFGGHKLDQTVNQDEAVAQGAALRAAALTGAAAGVQVADVISYDICCSDRCSGKGKYNVIVPKFTPIPSAECFRFEGGLSAQKYSFFEQMHGVDELEYRTSLGTWTINRSYSVFRTSIADLALQVDTNGMFTFSIDSKEDQWRFKAEPINFHPLGIDVWVKAEEQFRRETAAQLERVNAEVELESLCFELQSALSSPELTEHCPPIELESYRNSISRTMKWIDTNEHAALDEINNKITKLNNVKIETKRRLDSAQRKALAAKEEAARRQAEKEKLADQISEFKLLLTEVVFAVNDSDLVRHSDSQELKSCKAVLSSLMTWQENIESASLAQVSEKLSELTRLGDEVHELEAEAARVKALEEEKAARRQAEMEKLADQISAFRSILSDVICDANDLTMHSHSPKLESCKATLSSLMKYEENIESSSLTDVSKKLGELKCLKHQLDQLIQEAAHKKDLEEKEFARKQADMKILADQISAFESLLSEVNSTLAMYLDRRKFESCKAALFSLETWRKENAESSSHTEVKRKLAELKGVEDKIRQLKADAARMEEKAAETTPAPAHLVPLNNSEQSNHTRMTQNLPQSRNAALNSIKEKNKSTENAAGRSTIPQSSNRSPVTCATTGVNNSVGGAVQSSMSRPAKGENEPRSSSRARHPSGERLTEHRSSGSRTREGSRDREAKHRSYSLPRPSSDSGHVEHFSRVTSDYGAGRGDERASRERSSSGVRHRSKDSKKSRSSGSFSLEESEQSIRQTKYPFEKRPTNQELYLHRPKFTVENTNRQQNAARFPGSSLNLMKQSAVVNNNTLPSKNTSTVFLPQSRLRSVSKESQTYIWTASASTQTDLVSESCRASENKTSGSDEEKNQPEKEDLIKKYKDKGILFPLLEIIDDFLTNIIECETCVQFRFRCVKHNSEASQNFNKILGSLQGAVIKSKTASTTYDHQTCTSFQFSEETGKTSRPSTSHVNDRTEHGVSNGTVDTITGSPRIRPHHSNWTPTSRASVDGPRLSAPEGSPRPHQTYNPVYTTARSEHPRRRFDPNVGGQGTEV